MALLAGCAGLFSDDGEDPDPDPGNGDGNGNGDPDPDPDDDDDDQDGNGDGNGQPPEGDERVAVETLDAVDVGRISATLRGDVTELDNVESARVGFRYRLSGRGEWQEIDAGSIDGTGRVEERAHRLESDTRYDFEVVVETDEDVYRGGVVTFETESRDSSGSGPPSGGGSSPEPSEEATVSGHANVTAK